jgi:hypothetical protein
LSFSSVIFAIVPSERLNFTRRAWLWHDPLCNPSASPGAMLPDPGPFSGHERNREEAKMDLYIIRRHGVWSNEDELAATNEKSLQVGEEMKDRLRWIRSYAVTEEDGRIGSVCIYEASDREAIREHGQRIGAPSEDVRVARGTAVKRDDPEPVKAV